VQNFDDDEPTVERPIASTPHQDAAPTSAASVDVALLIAKLELETFAPEDRQTETDRMYSIGWNDRANSLVRWLKQRSGS
jgi:hypothetical protein